MLQCTKDSKETKKKKNYLCISEIKRNYEYDFYYIWLIVKWKKNILFRLNYYMLNLDGINANFMCAKGINETWYFKKKKKKQSPNEREKSRRKMVRVKQEGREIQKK